MTLRKVSDEHLVLESDKGSVSLRKIDGKWYLSKDEGTKGRLGLQAKVTVRKFSSEEDLKNNNPFETTKS